MLAQQPLASSAWPGQKKLKHRRFPFNWKVRHWQLLSMSMTTFSPKQQTRPLCLVSPWASESTSFLG